MSQFTLITGGARSGKSRFAEFLAAQPHEPVTYIATAQVWDEEMAHRVKKHQEQRPSTWKLIEEPLNIRETLLQLKEDKGIILLDCVTLWLSNLLLAGQGAHPSLSNEESPLASQTDRGLYERIEPEIIANVQNVARLAKSINPYVIFVTNEVGQGIVPENPLARAYRDLAGRCNQILARSADEVYMVVAGYPMEIKHSGEKLFSSLSKE